MLWLLVIILIGALSFVIFHKPFAQDMAAQMGTQVAVAQIVVGAVIFLIVLIVVHLITARLSDAILDSRIGMIDRVLGFIASTGDRDLITVETSRGAEQTIEEAVRSVLGQTERDLELVVVDDGSVDATGELVRAVADRRVRVVRNEEPLGLAGALNVGLDAASGTYVARLDADDLALPAWLGAGLARLGVCQLRSQGVPCPASARSESTPAAIAARGSSWPVARLIPRMSA